VTTATTNATTPTTTTVKDVYAAEVARLDDALAASKPRLARLALDAATQRDELRARTAELAALKQDASRLQQQLNAATSQPERHRIEQELEKNLIAQGPVTDHRLTAAERLAGTELTVVRETAQAVRARSDLTRATAELARVREESAAATARVNALPDTVARLRSEADELSDPAPARPPAGGGTPQPAGPAATAPAAGTPTATPPAGKPAAQAVARLSLLLGGPAMLTALRDRVTAARKEVETRTAALAKAQDAALTVGSARSKVDGDVVRTAADLAAARVELQDVVEAAHVRMAAAKVTLAAIIAFPAPPEQAAITAVAEEAGKGTAGALDRWEVMVPVEVTELAIALIDIEDELDDVRHLDAKTLTDHHTGVETAHATALATRLALQHDVDTAAAAVAAAADDIAALQATAADRQLSLVRGDR
jgi:hypothetical protein